MQAQVIDHDTVRRLADLKSPTGRTLSIYVDLDPAHFAAPPARKTQVRSLLDEARRLIEAEDGLAHDDVVALRSDLERAEQWLADGGFDGTEARGIALFASTPADLFEVVRLPHPVEAGVAVADTPFVEPLLTQASADEWCVLLVNRSAARILRGTAGGLEEVSSFDDDVHGQHRQGGWSSLRYQLSVEKEASDHFDNAADALFRALRRRRFDRLLVGAPKESRARIEDALHPYVRERLVGFIDIDVENSTVDAVRDAAAPLIEAHEAAHERAVLDRLREGVGQGTTGTAGLATTLEALNERRVEVLAFEAGFSARGVECPACGWLGPEGHSSCPADETPVEKRDDLVERAAERALQQSAEVLVVRRHEDLGPLGRIGAVLRF